MKTHLFPMKDLLSPARYMLATNKKGFNHFSLCPSTNKKRIKHIWLPKRHQKRKKRKLSDGKNYPSEVSLLSGAFKLRVVVLLKPKWPKLGGRIGVGLYNTRSHILYVWPSLRGSSGPCSSIPEKLLVSESSTWQEQIECFIPSLQGSNSGGRYQRHHETITRTARPIVPASEGEISHLTRLLGWYHLVAGLNWILARPYRAQPDQQVLVAKLCHA